MEMVRVRLTSGSTPVGLPHLRGARAAKSRDRSRVATGRGRSPGAARPECVDEGAMVAEFTRHERAIPTPGDERARFGPHGGGVDDWASASPTRTYELRAAPGRQSTASTTAPRAPPSCARATSGSSAPGHQQIADDLRRQARERQG